MSRLPEGICTGVAAENHRRGERQVTRVPPGSAQDAGDGLTFPLSVLSYAAAHRPRGIEGHGAFTDVMHTLRSNVLCPTGARLRMSTPST